MKNTILIIDTELNQYERLKKRLELQQYTVHTFTCHQEGLYGICHLEPDLIIYQFQLFLRLEMEMSTETKKQLFATPFIIIHSTKKEEDVLLAFHKGAADFVINPFKPRELEARVKAILRRMELTKTEAADQIKMGNIIVDSRSLELDLTTHKVSLSKTEMQLLLLIMERSIISREEILKLLWGHDYDSGNRIVDVNIFNLRRKIEQDPKNPQYIKTIKGYGYRFVPPQH